MAFINASVKSVEFQFPRVAFVNDVTVDILIDGNLSQGSSKGRPRGFISLPLAHQLDWVRSQVGASDVGDC